MTLAQIGSPFPVFTGLDGSPLDNGFVWFGVADLNPETNPIAVFYDPAMTEPAPSGSPFRTSNGYIMRNGAPANLYVDGPFSVTVREKDRRLVVYSPQGYQALAAGVFLEAASNLSDVASASTARTNLGVAIGSDVQAYNANLAAFAGKTAPSGAIVGTTDAQTLSDKTLTSPVINGTVTGTALADQATMEAGTVDNELATPLGVAQAIAAQVPNLITAPTYELLSRTVIAGSPATIEFIYDANLYDAIVFKLGNVRMGNDLRSLFMRTSSDSGASFDAGASDYALNGSVSVAGTSSIFISGAATMGLAGSEAGFSGVVSIYGTNLALRTGISIAGGYWDNSGNLINVSTSASRLANAVTNAVQFLSSGSGGFTNGGVITMYGVRNS